jgi:hypothetical protein
MPGIDKNYSKVCPKCNSSMIKNIWDKEKKRFVSKCLNCSYKGDELFKEVHIEENIKCRKSYQDSKK